MTRLGNNFGLIVQYFLAFAVGAASLWSFGLELWTIGVLAVVVLGPPLALSASAADAVLKFVGPVTAGAGAALLYMWGHSTPGVSDFLMSGADENTVAAFEFFGEQYFAVMSTLFAIITALILVKGIESFDRLNAAILAEANVIRSIVEFLRYFVDGSSGPANVRQVDVVRSAMRRYCANFVENKGARASSENLQMLRVSAAAIGQLRCVDRNDEIALSEVMRALNNLFAVRAQRIACSETRIPLYMLITLFLMSFAIIAPFFVSTDGAQTFNAACIFVLTAFCVFVLMLLFDINTPFDGFWRVEISPVADLGDSLDHQIQPITIGL